MREIPGVSVSFEEFLEGCSPRLFRTALLLAGQDRAVAEDLLQLALERAYRHWARIGRMDDPERYVRRILAYASNDRWRLAARRRERPLHPDDPPPVAEDQSTQAGPIWFINKGIAPSFRFHNPGGTLKAVPVIVMLRDNSTARVQPSGTEKRYFRFLPGFNGTDRYTLRDGQATATFAGCSNQNSMYGNGFTEFYLGVIVAGPRCITLDVRTPGRRVPIPATLTFGKCGTSN